MAVTNYYTVEGSLVAEETGGSRFDNHLDALGSITAQTDSTQTVTAAGRYAAYGWTYWSNAAQQNAKYSWCGSWGYRKTQTSWRGLRHAEVYVRARHYSATAGRWGSADPIWPHEPSYAYAASSPTAIVDWTGKGCKPIFGGAVRELSKVARCERLPNVCFVFPRYRCHLDIRVSFYGGFETHGCHDCMVFQWVRSSRSFRGNTPGRWRRDNVLSDGSTVPWPLDSWSSGPGGTTYDEPGVQGTLPGCPSADWWTEFLTCVCCKDGGVCVYWGYGAKYTECSQPRLVIALPTPMTLHNDGLCRKARAFDDKSFFDRYSSVSSLGPLVT